MEKIYEGFSLKSRLQLMGVAIVICMAIYIPILSQITVFGRSNVETITYVTLILFFMCYLLIGKKSNNNQGAFVLYLLCLSFVLINFIHLLMGAGGELQVFLYNSHSFVASILILLMVAQFNDSKQVYIFKILFGCISVIFLIQLALSAYESFIGEYFGAGAEALSDLTFYDADPLEARFIANTLYSNMSSMLGLDAFNFSFTMMLGQHNAGGSQLVFYNLVFLFAYYSNKKIQYAILAGLVIVAVLLNTTRYALASIVITDLIFYIFIIKRRVFRQGEVRNLVVLSVLIVSVALVLMLSNQDLTNAISFSEERNLDTLNGRLDIYDSVWQHLLEQDIAHMFLGNFGKEFTAVTISVLGVSRNFESLLIHVYYAYGFVGLIVLLYCLRLLVRQCNYLIEPYSYFLYLIVFNVIAISVISGLLFSYGIFTIVTILCLFVLAKSREYQGKICATEGSISRSLT